MNPTLMKAVLVKAPGGVEQLVLGSFPRPEPAEDELLVKVKAASLNRADIMQRQGNYPPPRGASPLLGLDMAGVIEQIGTRCQGWRLGDRVCGLLPGGGYAEYVALPGGLAMRVPDNLSFEQAAAIPEAFLTAYQALFLLGRLQGDEWVLIHAGASGVGTAAIQLTREAGSKSIVTAGSQEKLVACQRLGAVMAINYRQGAFDQSVLTATEDRGVNLVLDFIGAPYWEQHVNCVAVDGRLVLLSTLGGATIESFSLRDVMRKRIQLMGTTLRNRSQTYKAELTQRFVEFALPRFADGRLKPVLDRVFRWEDVSQAHQYMEGNHNIGKIVLTRM